MIHIKSAAEIEEMKQAGSLAKQALRLTGTMVRPGVSMVYDFGFYNGSFGENISLFPH